MPDTLVSICIPAYENAVFLIRLLDSVLAQNYPHIEVIISDDSAGEDIKNALSAYDGKLIISYFKNTPALKTPSNWNNALDKATGNLLMLVHQDDWFADAAAISKYVNAFEEKPEADFVFCRSMAFDNKIHDEKIIIYHKTILYDLQKHPEGLLLGNVIGPPSNLMFRKSVTIRYALPYIWLVDVEYYIRLLKAGHQYFFLDEPLVSVGIHEQQVTAFVIQNKTIILKEHLMLSGTISQEGFADWRIYDLYWRLLRNYRVQGEDDLDKAGIEINNLSQVILQMLHFQKKIPYSVLQTGLFSKILMWISFLNRPKS